MVTNLTSNHENAGSNPGLTQWVEASVAMSCGVGHRRSLGLALLWLWRRPEAIVLIRPLAWELPYAAPASLKSKTNKQTNKTPVIFKQLYIA